MLLNISGKMKLNYLENQSFLEVVMTSSMLKNISLFLLLTSIYWRFFNKEGLLCGTINGDIC